MAGRTILRIMGRLHSLNEDDAVGAIGGFSVICYFKEIVTMLLEIINVIFIENYPLQTSISGFILFIWLHISGVERFFSRRSKNLNNQQKLESSDYILVCDKK